MTWSQSNVSRIDGPILGQSCESHCMIFCVILAIVPSEYSGWAPWTVAHQAPLFMEFSRQEYWSGLPFPSPWDLPDSGIKPKSLALQADGLTSEPPGKPFPYLELHYYNHWSHTELHVWSAASNLVLVIFICGSVIHLVIQEKLIL